QVHEDAARRLRADQFLQRGEGARRLDGQAVVAADAGDAAAEEQVVGKQEGGGAHQMASGPRSPVRMRMQSSSGRMKIFPSPMRPSGPVRPASMIALTVGSTKSSLTAICSCTLRNRLTVSSWPR